MPQANNQFTGSKMNKDLSPRLVPNTQYIDARNATVLNSEGGESGLLQNTEGNTLLTNLNLTGENLEIIGLFSDKVLDRMFLFVTNWNDPSSNESSSFASLQSSHYICMYDIKTSSATTLVSGNFLNFSKTNPILAINLLEDLLFFTDDRNQPRKINIDSAISDPAYYTEEANISVLRYFPWNAPRLSKNILSPGETDKYPLEVKSELLITTQPLVITKSSPVTYSIPIGPSIPNGWTTSGSGNNSGARVQFDLEGSIPNIFIANAMVMGDGGNGFSIGDTITASTIWTGIPSSSGDIVFTIGSQNIAQTPTMKDVVSTNLPGAIERKVANNTSQTTFSCGAPVKRGVSVWTGSLSTPSMPDTPRPILLTQYGTGGGSLNFGYLPGTSLNATVGTGLEIAVSAKRIGTSTTVNYTVDVVSSGNNYSSNQELKINSASSGGPIPGLAVDIILDIETSKLDVLPANSFVGTIITGGGKGLSDNLKITDNTPGASGDSVITQV